MGKRRILVLLILLLGLCGCGFPGSANVEEKLRPPRVGGEQEVLQKALDGYLTVDYLLTFPRSGEHREAFLFEDMDGDGEQEAVCFYRRRDGNTHVLVLHRDGEEWTPVSDIQGGSADIDWVAWGHMFDRGSQLLVGWGIYNNSRDRQLVLYSLEEHALSARFETVCAAACMGDITDSGQDSLLVFCIDSELNAVSAVLYRYENGGMTQRAAVDLDGFIRSFGTPRLEQMAPGQYGVFVDGYKDASSITTELVYWKDERLNAPFYNVTTNTNSLTVREGMRIGGLTGGDVNGDGIWEWPQNRRLVGYQTVDTDKAQWLTVWMRYDPEQQKPVKALYSLVNTRDRYLLALDADWFGATADGDRLTMSYTPKTHLMEVQEVRSGVIGRPLIRIAPISCGVEEEQGGELIRAVLSDKAEYAVWYRSTGENGLTQEEVRYMLTPMP